MAEPASREYRLRSADGHAFNLMAVVPAAPRAVALWLPAMGVPARHYLPLAQALAASGIASYLHEWRGIGSSDRRAARDCDWGYRQLLLDDIPASLAQLRALHPHGELVLGGHSLGGQLAACMLGLQPALAGRAWLVASGSPHASGFPAPIRHGLPLAYHAMPAAAALMGRFPGRALRFAGNEARGVISDWARTARSGRYVVPRIEQDIEAGMRQAGGRALGITLDRDWLAPQASLQVLLDKLPGMQARRMQLDAHALGAPADHFRWMRHPGAIAAALAADLD